MKTFLRGIRPSYIAGVIAFLVTALVAHGRSTQYNNYVLLAQAFLHGHAWIDWPGAYIDALAYHGRHYIIEGPMPAILLLPFVALWSTAANQTLLAVLLAGVAIGAAWELCERYGVSAATTAWLCAFMLVGTDLLWCAMLGDVWFIAHVSAACFTLLALVELAGKRRGWLVALWAACAFESRFTLVLVVPVYALLVARGNKAWRQSLYGFVAILIPVTLLWVCYNAARWGTWYDIGYTAWYHQDQAGSPVGSPFQLQYLSYQLQSFFQQAPVFVNSSFPWVKPDMSGVALTWTSPALLLSLLTLTPARLRSDERWLIIGLWVAVILTAVPNFVYYVNGFAQFGMRHALDFEPFLFALMALGVRQRLPVWGQILIVYSVLVGFWGCWYWNVFFRNGN